MASVVKNFMKILHLYRTYFPETFGGIQEAIRQIALSTQPYGFRNEVFTLAKDPQPQRILSLEGEIIRARSIFEIASCDFTHIQGIRACRAAANSADIIHMHYPWPFADMMLPLIRRRSQPLLVTYHSDIVRQANFDRLYAPIRATLLHAAAKIVATSPKYAQTSPVLVKYKDKVTCIPLALSPPPPEQPDLQASWKAKLGDNFFLFIGLPRYYKGLQYLIEAIPKTTANFVIIGEGSQCPQFEALASKVGARNLTFLGRLPENDKNALIKLCRAIILPSHLRSEAFGVVLLEGARASKPLISCEIGTGTSWVNLNNKTGLVVPPADPDALAAAVIRLSSDDVLCRKFGHNAYQRWLNLFTPEIIGKQYSDLYIRLLQMKQ